MEAFPSYNAFVDKFEFLVKQIKARCDQDKYFERVLFGIQIGPELFASDSPFLCTIQLWIPFKFKVSIFNPYIKSILDLWKYRGKAF
mgnify:FL=1